MLDTEGFANLQREVTWLTSILSSRGFPLAHLARNLELTGDVVDEQLGAFGGPVSERLRSVATTVRDRAQ